MVRRSVVFLCLVLVGAAWGQDRPEPEKHPLLETMKGLAGDWVAADPKEGEEDKVVIRYEVTSTGFAVLETYDPGLPTEEITIYSVDGDALMLKHHCALGNQARMHGKAGAEKAGIAFECIGPGNVASEDDGHMHKMALTIADEDHIQVKWFMYRDGKEANNYPFDLKRKG